MSVQKVPLETMQKIRQHIQHSLVLSESENHPRSQSLWDDAEPMPEPDSLSDLGSLFNLGGPADEATYAPNNRGKWFISSANPGAALLKLPGLKLKPDWRLVSYLYRVPEDGVGVTWAVPELLSTTVELEKALATNSGDRNQPPQPKGALTCVMEAIDGDRSPASFIVASLLQRELKEFGMVGKSCGWSQHRLIGALPNQVQWHWKIDPPKDLSPKICLFPDGRVVIEFFSCRTVSPITIVRHVDQYSGQHYKADALDRPVAIAQRA